VNLIHLIAVTRRFPIYYVDASVAFMHTPEEAQVFTHPAEGFGTTGFWWRLKRKINGKRDGAQGFQLWLAAQIRDLGFRQCVLSPTLFVHDELHVVWTIHVDDFCCTGPQDDNLKLLKQLEQRVLLKIAPPMMPEDGKVHTFLSRERRWTSEGLVIRPLPKFVNECCELLGLEGCKISRTPGLKVYRQKT
jgi:hypothetical protein